jgi:uncharacterized BrkB/YihY/UPF0761 family membrane protein
LGALTMITGVLDSLAGRYFLLFNRHWNVDFIEAYLLQAIAMIGLIVMLTSLYMVMPTAKVGLKRALIGGVISACLWEIVRTFLVWYFDNLSLVNVVYGSLATVVIVLLSLEVAAVIILLGAQVIAELERSADLDLPWYLDPDEALAAAKLAPTASLPSPEAQRDVRDDTLAAAEGDEAQGGELLRDALLHDRIPQARVPDDELVGDAGLADREPDRDSA